MNTVENCNEKLINVNNNLEEDVTHLVDLTQIFEEEVATESIRPTKRMRENEDDWNLVKRRKERLREGRGVTELCISCKNIFPKQFALAKLFKEKNIRNINKVKYVNPYKINIEFNDASSAENLDNSVYFKELGWKIHRPFEVRLSYGVIKNIELDVPEEELLKNITSTINIVNVRRLKKRDKEGSGWKESETWRVGFEGSSLPSHVYLYDMRVVVEPFVFQVTQCSKCWRYGHTIKMCPSKSFLCPKCGGKHENCESTIFRCINCCMNHMALDRNCPVFRREKKLRDIMSEFNVSYRKALDMYVPPPSLPSTSEDIVEVNVTKPISPEGISASPILHSKPTYAQATVHPKVAKNTTSTEGLGKTRSESRRVPSQGNPYGKNLHKNIVEGQETNHNFDMDSGNNISREEAPDNSCRDNNECPRDYSLKWLIDKLRFIIFMKSSNIKNKILSIVQVSIEWVVSWIFSIIPEDLSFLKNFFNNG